MSETTTIEEKIEDFKTWNRQARRNKKFQRLHGLNPAKENVISELKELFHG
jgi:2-polyprenyl-3-methyl-5-hydroxy-6-metoxy-1,4-benzoquinol methylase